MGGSVVDELRIVCCGLSLLSHPCSFQESSLETDEDLQCAIQNGKSQSMRKLDIKVRLTGVAHITYHSTKQRMSRSCGS